MDTGETFETREGTIKTSERTTCFRLVWCAKVAEIGVIRPFVLSLYFYKLEEAPEDLPKGGVPLGSKQIFVNVSRHSRYRYDSCAFV